MTEFDPKIGVQNVCRNCTHFVLTLVAALGLSVGVAQAGAWEEFESRCLVPMEDIQEIDLDGLADVVDWLPSQGEKYVGRKIEDGTYYVVLDAASNDILGCGLQAATTQVKPLERAFLAWEREALATQRYVSIDPSTFRDSARLESTFREPRMRVHFAWTRNDAGDIETAIYAEETNLES